MWRSLGTVDFWGMGVIEDWKGFQLGGNLSESTLKIEFLNITEPLDFRYLLRRRFSDTNGRKIVEKANYLYPSVEPQIIEMVIPKSYQESMVYYTVEVKKILYWKYRYIHPDPQVQMNIQSWQA
ncbi:hypothetical protein [Okeania sp. SIO2B3]|uniref:hypothetical protein n=1 Tax=Okeania sp. SIO2B3 TaxID=2607784 RepID=UPI0013C0FB82|nr:hypothetical protein [Okeania sp. SIO2B3]NET40571.1 hypothetical protein [Okeania sp. SIO2B3]